MVSAVPPLSTTVAVIPRLLRWLPLAAALLAGLLLLWLLVSTAKCSFGSSTLATVDSTNLASVLSMLCRAPRVSLVADHVVAEMAVD